MYVDPLPFHFKALSHVVAQPGRKDVRMDFQ